ncbi:hypothetical protein EB1_29400 [Empedobacter brevis NBRC 14943 = ATCC 43319]|uniref:IgGFc-binding protein N-terminal domain-containing protein n=1 Tax=Empedobacter brevis NBRC 14943 = ATCC 43319 TaxID=1218108 RepID=A0A511NK09_9FLAO|nr:hypothetical protein EB1_29400 [Empedobacter brevis NBRC 14943 = ATCC 43319]
MKKNIVLLILLLSVSSIKVNAQIVIGDNSNSSDNKALLSFTSENMGVILPIINSNTEAASTGNVVKTPGTIYVSRADKQVKVYMAVSPQNSTGLLALTPTLPTTVTLPTANTSVESTENAGVIIGSETTTQKGILVLESEEKTMVMPLIGTVEQPPHKYVKNPYIGTIGFAETENVLFPSTKPTKKLLWVFNGGNKSTDGAGQWHLWRSGVEMPPSGIIDQDYLDNLP